MPRWALLICNLTVVAVLAALAYFIKLIGWQFGLGLTVGFFACYFYFENWKQDLESEKEPHFTEQ